MGPVHPTCAAKSARPVPSDVRVCTTALGCAAVPDVKMMSASPVAGSAEIGLPGRGNLYSRIAPFGSPGGHGLA